MMTTELSLNLGISGSQAGKLGLGRRRLPHTELQAKGNFLEPLVLACACTGGMPVPPGDGELVSGLRSSAHGATEPEEAGARSGARRPST